MGEIKTRAQVGVSGSYNLGGVIIGATLEHALKEDDHKDSGKAFTHLELSLGTNLYDGDYGSLDASLSSHFGDSNYMQTWYGVTTGQPRRVASRPTRPARQYQQRHECGVELADQRAHQVLDLAGRAVPGRQGRPKPDCGETLADVGDGDGRDTPSNWVTQSKCGSRLACDAGTSVFQ
ncbi:mltA-interacting protein mipA domain-containing protein [Ditylenchus destructor]|uniref:MltA-interacting protein mipA domain-containing protein n=1 Tax=Ditylenchus destructor TaxID=166010 RepID=A0AAD4MFI2_9BILA|nr:mltA-interacting protein mipA domain-containing protein [Ditylenchus destructor]